MGTRIAVVGVGGVGGYFGGKLCRSLGGSEAELYFIARGAHLEEIRKRGLAVSTSEGDWVCRPTLATDRIEDLPPLDVCLLCVKSYDLSECARRLAAKVSRNTLVVPLANGVDIYERMRGDLGEAKIFPACVYVGTHIERPGKVTQRGGAGAILLGADPRVPVFAPRELFELFSKSSIEYRWFDDVSSEIWKKFIFIAAFSLVTAAYDKTLGQVMESEELGGLVKGVMREIFELSQKKGVSLPSTVVEDAYRKGSDFPLETKTSFQRDFERADKPDERDLFAGTILRQADLLGIEVSAVRRLSGVLNGRKPLSE